MSPTRPNVILITTDQQRCDTLSCYGSRFTQTPNIDRLAAEGVRCERAYCTNPVCTPSRVSIFTGRSVSRHGVWNVGVNIAPDEVTIGHRLGAAGYRTHYVGKAHFEAFGMKGQNEDSRENISMWASRYPDWRGPYCGFESIELALGHTTFGLAGHYGAWVRSQVTQAEFESFHRSQPLSKTHFGGEAHDWGLPTRLHNSVWTADRTISFLRSHDRATPFLLAVGFEDPHHPHCLPRDMDAGLRVDPAAVPPPDYTEGELDDKPAYFREAHEGRLEKSSIRGDFWVAGQGLGADYRLVSEHDARLGRAYYHGMVRLIDQQLGRILATLDDLDLANNTLIIFTTDHGELLGNHGLWMKGPFHYEQLVRVPLIFRWPQGLRASTATPNIVSHLDLARTICAAADVEVDSTVEGVNQLPSLRNESLPARDAAMVECVDDPRGVRLKTIVTANRKLTWHCGQSSGELYDLESDPREKVNRWGDPRYAADQTRLLSRIIAGLEPLEPRRARHSYA